MVRRTGKNATNKVGKVGRRMAGGSGWVPMKAPEGDGCKSRRNGRRDHCCCFRRRARELHRPDRGCLPLLYDTCVESATEHDTRRQKSSMVVHQTNTARNTCTKQTTYVCIYYVHCCCTIKLQHIHMVLSQCVAGFSWIFQLCAKLATPRCCWVSCSVMYNTYIHTPGKSSTPRNLQK